MGTVIRRLGPEDAAAWRALRLEGLAAHPEAFGASSAEEAAQPLEFFAGRIAGSAVFGAGEPLVGTAALLVPTTAKLRHKATVWGMYVRREAQGRGLGAALLDAVLAHAAGVAEEVRLTCVAGNAGALALYRRAGFVAYGVEPRALVVDGVAHDEVLMAWRRPRGRGTARLAATIWD